jgi:hypothetical protein
VDRHRFGADPDQDFYVEADPNFHVDADPDPIRIRIGIRTMPILMRILPQVLHTMENQNITFMSSHNMPV